MSTGIFVSDVRIVSVTPYSGTSDELGSPIDKLRSMIGQKTSIAFGNTGRESLVPLRCNELYFDFDGDEEYYTARMCNIPDGLVQIKFTIDNVDGSILSVLKANIDNNISAQRNKILIVYAIGIPMFLIIFLLGSLVVWAVKRAVLYVRAG